MPGVSIIYAYIMCIIITSHVAGIAPEVPVSDACSDLGMYVCVMLVNIVYVCIASYICMHT